MAAQSWGWLKNLDVGNMQQVAIVAVCLVLGIVMQFNFPRYLSGPNIEVTLTNFVTEGIMALGMTIVMITRTAASKRHP